MAALSLSALAPKPLHEGFLRKTASSKGEDVFRGNWQDRYFKVFKDRMDYFKQAEDNTPAGTIDLRDAHVDPVEPDVTQGTLFCIRIAEARQNFVYLATGSQSEREMWLALLRGVAGGFEEQSEAAVAAATAAIFDRSMNAVSFTVLLQEPVTMKPPELMSISLGGDGQFRLYRDCHLIRTFEPKQLLNVESTLKAEFGIGIGVHWRQLCQVKIQLKLTSAAAPAATASAAPASWAASSTNASAANLTYHVYLQTEEECEVFVQHLRSMMKGDYKPVKQLCMKAPTYSISVETVDRSFKSGWAARFAVLHPNRIIIFKTSNDHSPYRAIYLSSLLDIKPDPDSNGMAIKIYSMLEREPIVCKWPSAVQLNQWMAQINKAIAAAIKSVEENKPKPFELPKPTITHQAPRTRLTLDDLSDNASTKAGEGETKSLFDFEHPTFPGQPLKKGEPSYVITFGSGASGQLGHRNKDDAMKPLVVDAVKSKSVRAISAGGSHAGLVTDQGHVFMMGTGALGLGERMTESKTPYLLTSMLATPIRTLVCGKAHTLAISVAGVAYGWGTNTAGQCGLGHKNPAHYPTMIEALKSLKTHVISAGGDHSAAIVEDGQLYSWGSNANGCLGIGNTEMQLAPTLNAQLKGKGLKMASVSCGHEFTLALSSSGVAYATGTNDSGQLGMGDRAKRSIFVELPYFGLKGLKVFQLTAGASHSVALAIKVDTQETCVYTFGAAIVNGYREAQVHPISVGALTQTRCVSTSGSSYHTLTLNAAERPFAFGLNRFGELGNGEAGVQALVKMRLAPTIQVVQAAAGAAFSVLLCRGEPPAQLLPQSAAAASATVAELGSNVSGSDPTASNAAAAVTSAFPLASSPMSDRSSENAAEVQAALGLEATGNFADALDQIGKLLGMELALPSEDGTTNAAAAGQTVIQRGALEPFKLKSVSETEPVWKSKAAEPTSAAATPAAAPAVAAPVAPTATTAVTDDSWTAPSYPTVAAGRPSIAVTPFKFTAAATSSKPAPAPSAQSPAPAAADPAPANSAAVAGRPAAGSVAARLAALQANSNAGLFANPTSPPRAAPSFAAAPPKPAAAPAPVPTADVMPPPPAPVAIEDDAPPPPPAPMDDMPPPPPIMDDEPPPPPVPEPVASVVPPPAAVASPVMAAPTPAAAAVVPAAGPSPTPSPTPADTGAEVKKKEKKEKAPLPEHWKKVKDAASGRSYYYNEITNEVTWKRPGKAAADAPTA